MYDSYQNSEDLEGNKDHTPQSEISLYTVVGNDIDTLKALTLDRR